jgi:hypothetical protein
MDENPEFETQCARARVRQVDTLIDDMSDIEDKVMSGEIKPEQARVVLESQRWRAIKVAPQKYGDKTNVNHTGAVRVESVEWTVLEAQPQISSSV